MITPICLNYLERLFESLFTSCISDKPDEMLMLACEDVDLQIHYQSLDEIELLVVSQSD